MEEYNRTFDKFHESSEYFREHRTGLSIQILDRLHRYEATLRRINENDCNGHPRMKTECRDGKMFRYEVEDEKWEQRDRKKEISIQNKVKAIADMLGFKVQFNGDPRSGAIRFILPDAQSNNWDNETWGIYW